MQGIPSRKELAEWSAATNSVASAKALGFVQSLDDARISLVYSHANGLGQYVLHPSAVPQVLLPDGTGPRQAEAAPFNPGLPSAVEWLLTSAAVRRVASVHVSTPGPVTRFWIGLPDSNPLTDEQIARLETVAATCAASLTASASSTEAVE